MMRNTVTLSRLATLSLACALVACSPEPTADGDTASPDSLTAANNASLPDPTQLFEWTTHEKQVGFSHSTSIYATETFHAGYSSALPKSSLPPVTYQYAGETRDVDDYIASQKVTGLLVMKDSKIALERYANGANSQTLWESKSVGKSVLSTLVGIALKEGKIGSLDDAIDDSQYVPELQGSAYHGVTIRNLLRMASGVSWQESPYEDPSSDAHYILSTCIGNRTPNCTLDRLVSKARAVNPATGEEIPQGTVWNYNTGEAFLVGLALQRATGQTIGHYLEQKIWKPARMERDGAWLLESDNGVSFGGVGFNATLRDYGRFANFIMKNGLLPNGMNPLPTNWVRSATTWFAPSAIPDFADNGQYGYMWWFSAAYDDGINNPSPVKTKTGPVPLQKTTAPTAVKLSNRTSDWTFFGYGIYGQLIAVNQLEGVVVVQWSTWDLADPLDLELSPENPYNEENTFINAVINALHN